MDRARKQTASDVAKYILTKQGPMTGYQVQKLLYYCQAWNLAVNGEPLFDDEIKAYEHGPVVPSVSIQHKHQYSVQAGGYASPPAAFPLSNVAAGSARCCW